MEKVLKMNVDSSSNVQVEFIQETATSLGLSPDFLESKVHSLPPPKMRQFVYFVLVGFS